MRTDTIQYRPQCGNHHKSHRDKGPSSFWMQPPDDLFRLLGILPGQHILDMGCGAGDYTLEAARQTGTDGKVIALDHWLPTVTAVQQAARSEGLLHVCVMDADITMSPLPVRENDVDLCMVFTVFHIFDLSRHKETLFGEMARVIKPGGRLAVLECKKEKWGFGPPLHMRLAPEEVTDAAGEWGFKKKDYRDLGYNYLLVFTL